MNVKPYIKWFPSDEYFIPNQQNFPCKNNIFERLSISSKKLWIIMQVFLKFYEHNYYILLLELQIWELQAVEDCLALAADHHFLIKGFVSN